VLPAPVSLCPLLVSTREPTRFLNDFRLNRASSFRVVISPRTGKTDHMKASVRVVGAAVAGLVVVAHSTFGQVKGPRSYFPKNYPAPPANGSQPAAAGGAANNIAPAQPAQPPKPPPAPKFKDVATNSQFYFLADTNHAFPWMKISSSTATNMKNGVVRPINPETLIQR
jgi:hypothetical protein